MWTDAERQGFDEANSKQIGQVPKASPMWNAICKYAADTKHTTFLEVGTWNGLGSTMAFIEGFKQRKHQTDDKQPVLYSLEANKDKAEYACRIHNNNPNVHVIHGSVSIPSDDILEKLHPSNPRIAQHNYYKQDQANVFSTNKKWQSLKSKPESFDVVFLDGGEFHTSFDFMELQNITNVFILREISNKSKYAFEQLTRHIDWVQTDSHGTDLCIFEHRKIVIKKLTNIPIVIHHTGNYNDYFLNSVRINAKHNDVIVIGDEHNKQKILDIQLTLPNIEFIDVNTLHTPQIDEFKKCFLNYSFNPEKFELHCFLRTFYLRELLIQKKIEKICYVDSDCVILHNIPILLSQIEPKINIGISIVKNNDPLDMSGCIHNAIINKELCDEFIQLCFDVYQNRSKFHLIEKKWIHHKNCQAGGICDMTLWYLLFQHTTLRLTDMNKKFHFKDEVCTFDHNVHSSYGFCGNNTFKTQSNYHVSSYGSDIKITTQKDNKIYAKTQDQHKSSDIRLLSIHYQGDAKSGLASNAHNL